MHLLKSLAVLSVGLVSLPVLGVLSISGCSGGGAERANVYPVSGKITLNGAPVANAAVTFSPQGKQPVAMGRTDSSGEYKLTTYDADDGAAAGDYVVLVTKASASGAADNEDAMHAAMNEGESVESAMHGSASGQESSASLLPEKYSSVGASDLKATVSEGGENKFDFDLKP